MGKISVMIVEDSKTIRLFLEQLIGADPRFTVAASVESGEEALKLMPTVRPDVVSLDIRLPGMNGLEVTRHIMRNQPTPIVVCSASVEASDLKISMNALAAGALTVVEKPGGQHGNDFTGLGESLCRQLALMSSIKVVRQRFGARYCDIDQVKTVRLSTNGHWSGNQMPQCIGIVSSTGGPAALAKILSDIPLDFPAAILLVQHMTDAFHEGFVSWLGAISPIPVRIPECGESPQAGILYIAPNDAHMCMVRGKLIRDYRPPISYHRPSGTLLLESLAQDIPESSIGVILTGMGDDGCRGLAALRRAGARTIAEHESTAVVHGMPKVAIELGAAQEILPLDQIAPKLKQWTAVNIGV